MHPTIAGLLISAQRQEVERNADAARLVRSFRSETSGRRRHVRSSMHRIGFRG